MVAVLEFHAFMEIWKIPCLRDLSAYSSYQLILAIGSIGGYLVFQVFNRKNLPKFRQVYQLT